MRKIQIKLKIIKYIYIYIAYLISYIVTLLLRYTKRATGIYSEYRKQINRKRSRSQESDARYGEDTRSLLRRVDNAAFRDGNHVTFAS